MLNQRWRDRRDTYRPSEPIDTSKYEVAELLGPGSDNLAEAFVCRHHYSGSYPSARFRFALYRSAELVGVAVFSQPVNDRTLTNVFGAIGRTDAAELGRFVLLDDVPGNGESWFIARCFELLRPRLCGIVSFSDPFPRQTLDGRLVHPGHVGTIYQATNGVYLGRAARNTIYVLPDATLLNGRTLQKIRDRDRGASGAIERMLAAGADELRADEDATEWLGRALPKVARRMRHPGNHRYAWGFSRAHRRRLTPAAPYPKLNPSLENFRLVP